jgi:hypothetical protein
MHMDSYLITIWLQVESSGHRTQGKKGATVYYKTTYRSQEHHPLHINHRTLHHERAIQVILLKRDFTIRQRALDVARKYAASRQRTASQPYRRVTTCICCERTSHMMWAEVSDRAAFYV